MNTIIALTPPQRELEAVDCLKRHGYDAWTPVEYRWRSIGPLRKRRKEVRPYPMLPRYVFVALPPSASFYHLRAIAFPTPTPHRAHSVIAGYLERDGMPATLTSTEAAALRKISTDAPPRSIPLNRGFSPGEQVLIVDGPFKGWTTRVDRISRKRASCTLEFFGSTRVIEFDLIQLEAA
jgi:transcription antitermination factor NusG